VVKTVEEGMVLDKETGQITASYPWKLCHLRMKSSRSQAKKVQRSIERRLERDGVLPAFNEEMKKALVEGKIRELSAAEMDGWEGQVHFITVFPVQNLTFSSTKTWIVSNSVMRNSQSHLIFNDCMWAGPNALADMIMVLVLWRMMEEVLIIDLKKAYQAIRKREK
jgi:hypothetical protein